MYGSLYMRIPLYRLRASWPAALPTITLHDFNHSRQACNQSQAPWPASRTAEKAVACQLTKMLPFTPRNCSCATNLKRTLSVSPERLARFGLYKCPSDVWADK